METFSCSQNEFQMDIGSFNNIGRTRVASRQGIELVEQFTIHFGICRSELDEIVRHSRPIGFCEITYRKSCGTHHFIPRISHALCLSGIHSNRLDRLIRCSHGFPEERIAVGPENSIAARLKAALRQEDQKIVEGAFLGISS
jgi:hypothetical protein